MSKASDPKPDFTLSELTAFLQKKPPEPVETDFYSCGEWARRLGCHVRRMREILREAMEQDALETRRGRRLAIDGSMRSVVLYKINIK